MKDKKLNRKIKILKAVNMWIWVLFCLLLLFSLFLLIIFMDLILIVPIIAYAACILWVNKFRKIIDNTIINISFMDNRFLINTIGAGEITCTIDEIEVKKELLIYEGKKVIVASQKVLYIIPRIQDIPLKVGLYE